MKHLYSWALFLTLGAFALAQDMPSQRQPQQIPPQMPQTQQQPPTSDQSKISTANPSDVQNEIQTALQKEPTLATANINVRATDKNVELSGTVSSRDAKDTAEKIAKAHSGGLPVKNHLKVGGSSKTGPGQPPPY